MRKSPRAGAGRDGEKIETMRIQRGEYFFSGRKAEDSAKYYDIISKRTIVDEIYKLWDAAHKFGSRLEGPGVASFRDGIIIGENALEAEYIDRKRKEIFDSLPELNRSRSLKEKMTPQYCFIEDHFEVTIKFM